MKKIIIAVLASIIALCAPAKTNEINDRDKNLINAALLGWHIRLSAGYNIGGTLRVL